MNKGKLNSILIAAFALAAGAQFFAFTSVAHASTACPTRDSEPNLSGQISGSNATVTNKSTVCSYQIGFASYKIFDTNGAPINQKAQELFSNTSQTIGPGQTITLHISLPSCAYQTDLFHDMSAIPSFNEGAPNQQYYGSRNLDGKQVYSNNFCTNTPPPPPTLTASCANPANANIGSTVTWNSSPTGGTGSYSYSWSGSDSLSGNTSSVSKSYSTAGTKTGTVRVTSGSQTATAQCSTTINQPQSEPLIASCATDPGTINIGDTTNWTVTVAGGSSAFTYAWSGSDGLSGSTNVITKSYTTSGTKTGTVHVTSGNQTATAQCSVIVKQPHTTTNITLSCSPSSINPPQNTTVTWSANVSYGSNCSLCNGGITYAWTGTDGLSGSSRTVSQSYSNPGTKNANVTVTYNGQTASADCSTSVQENNYHYNQNYYNSQYYNQSYYNQGYYNSYTYVTPVTGACYASPSNPQVGQQVTWYVTAAGGNTTNGCTSCGGYNYNSNGNYNGNYYYNWSGSDGLYGSSNAIPMTYGSVGQKTAYVTISGTNGQQTHATCSVYVNGTYYVNPPVYNNPVPNYVTLNQVPYTGVGDTLKVILFGVTLTAWSAFIAYFIVRKRALKRGVSVSAEISHDLSANIKKLKDTLGQNDKFSFLRRE